MNPNQKPLNAKTYGHISHLPDSRMGPGDHKCSDGQERIATKQPRDYKDLIIVQEKVDGSCCGVAKINNEIIALGRSGYLASTSPYEQHKWFARWVEQEKYRFYNLLTNGERVVGEWLMQAHGTRYDLPHEPFIPFDIMTGIHRVIYHEFITRIVRLDFIEPRLIHIGQPISVERVLKLLEPSGHGALDPVEGAVWRVERDGAVDFLCKYVRSDKVDGCYLPELNGGETIWNVKPEELLQSNENNV